MIKKNQQKYKKNQENLKKRKKGNQKKLKETKQRNPKKEDKTTRTKKPTKLQEQIWVFFKPKKIYIYTFHFLLQLLVVSLKPIICKNAFKTATSSR